MPAGSTYTPIATTTLGSAASTYTFSSIPSTYTDLVVVNSGTLNSTRNCTVRLNGDTGSNYSWTYLYGDGSSASSARASNTSEGLINYVGTEQSTTILQINNYSNSTTYKTVLSRASSSVLGTMTVVLLWRNTAAVTSLTLTSAAGQFQTGSTFTLYGIASA
jgi:hypothetical protein